MDLPRFPTRHASGSFDGNTVAHSIFRALCVPALGLFVNGAMANELEFMERTKVYDKSAEFKEPSGLAMGNEGEMFSVSDDVSKIFLLLKSGKLVADTKISKNNSLDLEGVAVTQDGVLLLADEASRSILKIEGTQPPVLTFHSLSEMKGYDAISELLRENPENKGIEGITVDNSSGTVFVVFENLPRLLVSISSDLKEIVAFKELSQNLGFESRDIPDEDLDVSGMAWAEKTGVIWIVSDTGRRIFAYNPLDQKAVGFDLSFKDDGKQKRVKKAEGVAVDEANGVLYVITDDGKKSRLYSFVLPDFSL